MCECAYDYERAAFTCRRARPLKDVAIYAPPPPFECMCFYVRARIRFHDRNAAAAAVVVVTTPPTHVLYRCRRCPSCAVHLCAGIVTVGRTTAWPHPESAHPNSYRAPALGPLFVDRRRRSGTAPDRVFSTHGGTRCATSGQRSRTPRRPLRCSDSRLLNGNVITRFFILLLLYCFT